MKIFLISAYVPLSENKGGITALPYFLLKDRPQNIQVVLYSHNINNASEYEIRNTEKELSLKIVVVELPVWFKIISKNKSLVRISTFLTTETIHSYLKLPKTVMADIKNYNPDIIWSHPFFYYKIAKLFPDTRVVVTGSDCNTLFQLRSLSDSFIYKPLMNQIMQIGLLNQLFKTEKRYNEKNILVHFVGLEDHNAYKKYTGNKNSFFLLHPHYLYKDKQISFGSGKLKVIIAGTNDEYMNTDASCMVNAFCNNNISNIVDITFLGKKWEESVVELQKAGYECRQIKWIDDYSSEIVKYDIQLCPISIGTGTKGKVLDGLVNGLLCIGSNYALENICVRHMESCVVYKSAEEIPMILTSVSCNKKKYELIAEAGRNRVLIYHSPERISRRFFEIAIRK